MLFYFGQIFLSNSVYRTNYFLGVVQVSNVCLFSNSIFTNSRVKHSTSASNIHRRKKKTRSTPQKLHTQLIIPI